MSQQRFIRCPHCGLPHEEGLDRCPSTAAPLVRDGAERRRLSPPPSEENYAWYHTQDGSGKSVSFDADDLIGFVGTVIGRKYLIEALIGKGGMGAVYRATNLKLSRPVALKVLHGGAGPKGDDKSKRLLREAQIAADLGHPNIVKIFDFGRLADGSPFQVMELLEGQTLSERLAHEGAIPEREVSAVADQILSALDVAHTRGVIHRDLKPENIFLVRRADHALAKLVDFGVSKVLSDASLSMTRTGMVVGTPYYLSPEQARGQSDLDPRVDIWAMGVVLYEAVTGVLPFNGRNYNELLSKILQTRPVNPSRFAGRISPGLETLILKALSRDRDERFSSAREMLRELRRVRREGMTGFPTPIAVPLLAPAVTPQFKIPVETESDGSALEIEDPTEVSDCHPFEELQDGSDPSLGKS